MADDDALDGATFAERDAMRWTPPEHGRAGLASLADLPGSWVLRLGHEER